MKKILLTLGTVCTALLAYAQTTLTLQPGAATGNDASLGYHDNYNTATQNYGTDIYLKAFCIPGAQGGQNTNRGILQFDLSSIPSNATIVSANLTLYATGYINATLPGHFGNNSATISRVTSSWSENSVTWNTAPSITTQNQVTLSQSSSATQDYTSNVSAMVQDMITNPGSSFGFFLQLVTENPSSSAALCFHSSDGPNAAKWPKLEITYTVSNNCMQPDPTAGEDASLGYHDNYNTATQNYGTDTYFKAFCIPGAMGGANSNRGVIRFDMSSIPNNAIVQQADLYLFATGTINAQLPGHFGANASVIERITAPWTESTVTWNTAPATTATGSASLAQSTSSTQDYIVNVGSMVQYQVSNPSQNYGFLFRLQTENPNSPAALLFYSSDDANALKRPQLCVTYTLDTGSSVHSIQTVTVFLTASPNPATDMITVAGTEMNDALINIYSMEGKIVKSITNKGVLSTFTFSVAELASGSYIIELISDNKRGTVRFVKEQ